MHVLLVYSLQQRQGTKPPYYKFLFFYVIVYGYNILGKMFYRT